jgi:hypothetical protein
LFVTGRTHDQIWLFRVKRFGEPLSRIGIALTRLIRVTTLASAHGIVKVRNCRQQSPGPLDVLCMIFNVPSSWNLGGRIFSVTPRQPPFTRSGSD